LQAERGGLEASKSRGDVDCIASNLTGNGNAAAVMIMPFGECEESLLPSAEEMILALKTPLTLKNVK
jgi:hypothetical protein